MIYAEKQSSNKLIEISYYIEGCGLTAYRRKRCRPGEEVCVH